MNDIAPTRLNLGIHDGIPERIYHADPAPEPSASGSILKELYRRSPEHARELHPRLNPAWVPSKATDAKDVGTILHSLLLQTPAPYKVFNLESWRGKNADIRDATRDAGFIPILAHKMDNIHATADAIKRRIELDFPDLHAAMNDPDTLKEATIICRINGVLCRSRIDLLPPAQYGFIADLKFTGLDAPPVEYERTVRREYRIQSDLYARAVQATRGDAPEFRFYAGEEHAPYGMAQYSFGSGAAERNRIRTDAALAMWNACLLVNEWPGYSTLMHTVEDEEYEDRRDLAATMRNSSAAQVTAGLVSRLHRIAAEIGGPLR